MSRAVSGFITGKIPKRISLAKQTSVQGQSFSKIVQLKILVVQRLRNFYFFLNGDLSDVKYWPVSYVKEPRNVTRLWMAERWHRKKMGSLTNIFFLYSWEFHIYEICVLSTLTSHCQVLNYPRQHIFLPSLSTRWHAVGKRILDISQVVLQISHFIVGIASENIELVGRKTVFIFFSYEHMMLTVLKWW